MHYQPGNGKDEKGKRCPVISPAATNPVFLFHTVFPRKYITGTMSAAIRGATQLET